MGSFRSWLESLADPVVFKTEQGSTYEFFEGKTTRFKSLHKFHPTADVGLKQTSERTVFVSPFLAQQVGMWGGSSAAFKRIVLDEDESKIRWLLSWNGEEMGSDRLYGDASYTAKPELGKHPLELWDIDLEPYTWREHGMSIYRNTHAGSKITQIGHIPLGLTKGR